MYLPDTMSHELTSPLNSDEAPMIFSNICYRMPQVDHATEGMLHCISASMPVNFVPPGAQHSEAPWCTRTRRSTGLKHERGIASIVATSDKTLSMVFSSVRSVAVLQSDIGARHVGDAG